MKKRSSLLTKEEREVIILTARHPGGEHLGNEEIARHLGVSVTRVKTLIHQACLKLKARNRGHAIWLAMRRGEIAVGELISFEELAEILGPLGPDVLRELARLIREEPGPGEVAAKGHILRADRRRDGLLTNRERDVLVLASDGLTNLEIADRLCISLSSVKAFLNRACAKLGAHRRMDAVLLALKQGEITIGDVVSLEELLENLASFGPDLLEEMARLLDEKVAKRPNSTGR